MVTHNKQNIHKGVMDFGSGFIKENPEEASPSQSSTTFQPLLREGGTTEVAEA